MRFARCALRAAAPGVLGLVALGAAHAAIAPAGDSTIAVQRLSKDYPSGSITTAETADRALNEANDVHTLIQREYNAEHKRCEHVFMVNSCMDSARKKERAGESEVRRVNLEAHDLHRALDAKADAASRADQRKKQEEEDAQRPERERQAMADYQAKQDSALQRQQDALKNDETAAQNSATSAKRQQDQAAQNSHDFGLRPSTEGEAERAYHDKQVEAANYATTRERDKETNAKQREQRTESRDRKAQEDAAEAAAKANAPSPKP